MAKQNCWEAKACGREPGGKRAHELGVCPAATEGRLNGVHEGVAGGRACWVAVGTLCGGTVQGSFATKYANCKECSFYQQVQTEEGLRFRLSANLLPLLKRA